MLNRCFLAGDIYIFVVCKAEVSRVDSFFFMKVNKISDKIQSASDDGPDKKICTQFYGKSC